MAKNNRRKEVFGKPRSDKQKPKSKVRALFVAIE